MRRLSNLTLGETLKKDWRANRSLYAMVLPVLAFYVLFKYGPIYGLQIAFKDFYASDGILGSAWVGIKHFKRFFSSFFFWRVLKNTLLLSTYSIVFAFPAPILLALSLNEVGNTGFKRTVQTIAYLPHFISLVVICGMIKQFTLTDGLINGIIEFFGMERVPMLQMPRLFRPIYIISDIWQGIGWGCIIYLSALAAIDVQLYDAASIDGCGRFRKMLSVTVPGISPTIIILLILRLGRVLTIGFEKILLLYNPAVYSTADVISTYVYREGLINANWSYAASVGLFNSVVNLIFIIVANRISRKVSETSLW